VTANIQGNDFIGLSQRFDDPRAAPIHLRVRVESVDKNDRLSFSFNGVTNENSFGVESMRLGIIPGGEMGRDKRGRGL
jgi:hypothetical protein